MNELLLFNFWNRFKVMLMIRIVFKTPKIPPSNLFRSPRLAKLAITVNDLASMLTAITTNMKVIAKAVICIVFGSQETCSARNALTR